MITYPYYLPSIIKAYRESEPDSEEAKKLGACISVNVGDPEVVKKIFSSSQPLHNVENPVSSTLDTIESFLNKFSPKKPMGTYIPVGEDSEEYILTIRKFIKNQQYKEAIEIIERRNLNNRQKNIYFADQIRFIKKLMAINSNKKKK